LRSASDRRISIPDSERVGAVRRTGRGTYRGRPAWEIIDRISQKYIGQPYPLRTDRIIFLIKPDHAQAVTFG
jgi:hypothetical protein